MGLVERFLAGDPRALARLATLIESRDPAGEGDCTDAPSHEEDVSSRGGAEGRA